MLEIYGRSNPPCPFCDQAKKVADKSGIEYSYFDLSEDGWDMETIIDKLGFRPGTIPIVLVAGTYLGGAKELVKFCRDINLQK